MRVARWYSNSDVRVEETPVPDISAGEMLVRIEACGICGSDVMEWYRIDRAPLVLGHEVGGQVVEVGKGVTNYREGDRVTIAHHVPCNTCKYCLSGHYTVCETLRTTNFYPGGLSEFVRLPEIVVDRGVFNIPDAMSYREATFAEPLACVSRALRKTDMKIGDTLLVIGSGIAGLFYVQLAKHLGAGKVFATDISQYRLSIAEKLGADVVINADEDVPSRVKELNNGYLADVVVLCTGVTSAVRQALDSVDRCGTVLFFAATGPGVEIPFSVNDTFWRNDVTLTTSYAASPDDYREALELISQGVINTEVMTTHILPMNDVAKGFQLVAEADESVKVIIEPQK
ncbi:MAG TPA: alcohol dehydrogenase catalytic domain-containing protein [Dehalococcoidia bacterium]|nr:alcohol dehydrogenase catalytic domain-containing protein [Dehalococcoidia bacterium]